jgi:ectoine hydroxylase-related dioxygenase (phytanoyl-CoA dioxygenase family)
MAEAGNPIETALTQIRERGFTILENAIEADLVDVLANELAEIERAEGIAPAANDFEGDRTIRIYNLLARGECFARVPIHEAVLPIIEGVLDEGCLISTLSSIAIDPGESLQPIHSDDQVIGLPRPHPPLVCNSMWALTDFTEENGATRVVPGSHARSDYPEYGRDYETVPAEMPKGSVLVWSGALWHGGGANRSQERRVGLAVNYCAGFIRQQENLQLGVPRELAARFPRRLQRLIGYGTYRRLIGHIDKTDPISLLGRDKELRTIWES